MSEDKTEQLTQKSRFYKKIEMKHRQFNFSQQVEKVDPVYPLDVLPLVQETQIVLYQPRKKIKTNNLIVEDLETLINNVIPSFLSQLTVVKKQIQFRHSSSVGTPKTSSNQSRLIQKIDSKQKQHMRNICRQSSYSSNGQDYSTIPRTLEFEYKIDEMKRMNVLSDFGVIDLSKNLQRLGTPNLTIDLFKKWNTDSSKISDSAVENLSKGIHQMPDLLELQLGLQGWGYWNNNITDIALNHITTALSALRYLNALKLDLNMWAYENEEITDRGTERLLGGISNLTDLSKLEINMKGWGDSNANITDESVNHISKCLRKLGNLSELKLVLWDKVSKPTIKKLNKALAELKNLTSIDLVFENSSDLPTPAQDNPNLNPKFSQIKQNALMKRKLMFQTAAINGCCHDLFRHEKSQDIISKLIG